MADTSGSRPDDPSTLRGLFHDALGGAGRPTPHALCAACVAALPVDRAAIVIVTAAGASVAAASDAAAGRVEEQQVTAGVGPAVDAHARGGPVLVADLAREVPQRWPALGTAAALGGSLDALPLQVGAIRLGVLDLYRDDTGPLDRLAFGDALEAAELVTTTLLVTTGTYLDGAAPDPARAVWPRGSPDDHELHQATGIVLVQLGGSAADAYVRLRARAYAEGRPLADLARDVIAHRVRFHPDPPLDPPPDTAHTPTAETP